MTGGEPKQYIDIEHLEMFRTVFWQKCKEKGITLEDLAERTGLSYIQIYRIVRGTKNTSLSNALAVIRAAEFQPSEIFSFEIKIPEYPPLRKDRLDDEGNRVKKFPGATFFIRAYLEDGKFDANGLTPVEIMSIVNSDLGKKFTEKDFSSAFSKIFSNSKTNPFKRIEEGSTYRYFPLSEYDKQQLSEVKEK